MNKLTGADDIMAYTIVDYNDYNIDIVRDYKKRSKVLESGFTIFIARFVMATQSAYFALRARAPRLRRIS